MTRRAIAVLSLLALAACYGRVSAYAASPSADAHACCRGDAPSKPAQSPSLSECCATPAATASVRVASAALALVAAVDASPLLRTPASVFEVQARSAAPPGPQCFLASVPARAPPLG